MDFIDVILLSWNFVTATTALILTLSRAVLSFILKLQTGCLLVVYLRSSGPSHRLSHTFRGRPWTSFCGLPVCSFSAFSGPPSLRPPRRGSGSHLTTRWPGSLVSSSTSATGPPWPPSPPTSRWWGSRSPTPSPSATGRRTRAPGFPTCTWPAWRSPCRTWR